MRNSKRTAEQKEFCVFYLDVCSRIDHVVQNVPYVMTTFGKVVLNHVNTSTNVSEGRSASGRHVLTTMFVTCVLKSTEILERDAVTRR